ncbi:MAG: RNA methyltransferase [Acidimicrobiia bacterium]|nr:RNA methyltransferase [Acidimicrobiia bacterium]
MIIPIDDASDPRIAFFVGLKDHQLRMERERSDPALQPLFIAEGDRLIRKALRRGLIPTAILRDTRRRSDVEDEITPDVPVFTVGPDVARSITGMWIHRWPLGAFQRPPSLGLDQVVRPDTRSVLAAENVINPTNLGAMVRSAVGLGVEALVVDESSCDPLYRRSLRVAMGAALDVAWTRVPSLVPTLKELSSRGFHIVALEQSASAADLRLLPSVPRAVLVVGNEGFGISESVLTVADHVASIPMSGGVESLNVTAAAAIACWELNHKLG